VNKTRIIVRWILRVLIAAVFVFSVVAKLVGIDQFELYIFSFGLFPLNFCFILARLCIGAELVLALFTLCGWFPRVTRLVTSGLLIFFSLFLCYAALIGRSDNCQCFGEMVDLNPMQSLLKNAVLLALVLVYYRLTPPKPRMRPRWIAFPFLFAAVLLAIPFVVSIPDNWCFGPSQQRYSEDYLQASLKEGQLRFHGVGEGRCLVAFVTPKCPYCKLARQKLDAIVERHGIDSSKLFYIEPRAKDNTPGTKTITTQHFLDITYGARPLVMLLDGTKVVATYHLRNIDEDQIANFFK
jgi:uncharacterized membrane protein YphA (DoxX/SURF4 family)